MMETYRMSPPGDIEPPVARAPVAFPVVGNYAGFWLRAVAAFIDTIIVIAVTIGPAVILAVSVDTDDKHDPTTLESLLYIFIILLIYVGPLVLGWLYEAIMVSSPRQATFGKQAVGIKVTDIDGHRLSFSIATGRHFAKLISALALLIGYFMAAFTERKQALHDIIMKTLVVKV